MSESQWMGIFACLTMFAGQLIILGVAFEKKCISFIGGFIAFCLMGFALYGMILSAFKNKV